MCSCRNSTHHIYVIYLEFQGQLSTPSASDLNVMLASSFRGENLLKIRLQRPMAITESKPLLVELSSRWTSLKLFRYRVEMQANRAVTVQLNIESIFTLNSSLRIEPSDSYATSFNNTLSVGQNRYRLEISSGTRILS